jgi:hypothetical protein
MNAADKKNSVALSPLLMTHQITWHYAMEKCNPYSHLGNNVKSCMVSVTNFYSPHILLMTSIHFDGIMEYGLLISLKHW